MADDKQLNDSYQKVLIFVFVCLRLTLITVIHVSFLLSVLEIWGKCLAS